MAFIEPMHRNKPNITYLLTCYSMVQYNITVYALDSTDYGGRWPEFTFKRLQNNIICRFLDELFGVCFS